MIKRLEELNIQLEEIQALLTLLLGKKEESMEKQFKTYIKTVINSFYDWLDLNPSKTVFTFNCVHYNGRKVARTVRYAFSSYGYSVQNVGQTITIMVLLPIL